MIDRRNAILGTVAMGLAASAKAQTPPPNFADHRPPAGLPDPTETIDLWPGSAPGMPAVPPIERVEYGHGDVTDRFVRGVVRPRLVVFRPQKPNGYAALITPGGGYSVIVIDKEGYELARRLNEAGYTCFVLFYRLPGDGWLQGADVALSDAQRAMRLIRARAGQYGIRADRVAAIGFSAGGHLCGDLATRFATPTYTPVDAADQLSARPDIAAPIYAVQSMTMPVAHGGSRERLLGKSPTPEQEIAHSPAHNVSAQTPPVFMVHAEDDNVVPVENTIEMRAALKAKGVTVESHLFTAGGHGFGLRGAAGKPVAAWPDLLLRWAATQGFE